MYLTPETKSLERVMMSRTAGDPSVEGAARSSTQPGSPWRTGEKRHGGRILSTKRQRAKAGSVNAAANWPIVVSVCTSNR